MEKKPSTLAIIPARFGSTRFPGKPLALIAGKTLLERTYENIQKCHNIDAIIVATDDKQIFEHVKNFGGDVVMTSSNCATGTERLANAVSNHPHLQQYPLIVNIQGDEPLLEPHVIDAVINRLRNTPDGVMSTAVVTIENPDELHDYSVNKCVLDLKGNALYFSRTLIPSGHEGQKQRGITYYKHLGIYAYTQQFLLHYATMAPTPLQQAEDLEQLKVLEHGYSIQVAIVSSRSIGVDRPQDIKKIEQYLSEQG